MRGNRKLRLLIGAVIVLFALIKYCSSAETNPYTGEKQHIALNEEQELNRILDKIKQKGLGELSEEERKFLNESTMSKTFFFLGVFH